MKNQTFFSNLRPPWIKNCFKKEKSAEEAINEADDQFKDLEEVINDFRERLPDDVPEDSNCSVLIDVDDELSTTGSTQSDAEILAEVMGNAGAFKRGWIPLRVRIKERWLLENFKRKWNSPLWAPCNFRHYICS